MTGAEAGMTELLSLYRHTNDLAYSKLASSASKDLSPSDDLDEDAINRENAQEFLRFELAILQISGGQEKLESYAATQENLIQDENEERCPTEQDPGWAEIQDGVKDEVIAVGSKIEDTDTYPSPYPEHGTANALVERVAQHTESLARTGVAAKSLLFALVPTSTWDLIDLVKKRQWLNLKIASWISQTSAPEYDQQKGDTEGLKHTELAKTLYGLLATHQYCNKDSHKSLLQLSDWSDSKETETIFQMFLSSCDSSSWQRAICYFQRSEAGTGLNLCNDLHRASVMNNVMHFNFNSDSLWRNVKNAGWSSNHDVEVKPVDFENVLSIGKLKADTLDANISKFRFALRLGSSLYSLLFGPWMQQELNSSNVQIIPDKKGDQIDMLDKAYISCRITSELNETDLLPDLEFDSTEYFPRCFLSFAQLLLDIANGKTSHPPEVRKKWYDQLRKEVQSKEGDLLMKHYWKAIENCLLYRVHYDNYLCSPTNDRAAKIRAAQHVILEKIVRPLRRHLITWEQQAQGQTLTGNKTLESSNNEIDVSAQQLKRITLTERQNTQPSKVKQLPEYKFPLWLQDDDHFPEIEKPMSDPNPNGFVCRMDEFNDLYISTLKKPSGGSDIDEPVRVAVIDTGFSIEQSTMDAEGDEFLSDTVVNKRVKGKRNFFKREGEGLDENDTEDTHGHGTLVARLVLQFAPRAELFIARITESKTLRMEDPTQLKKALRWAGENADIINLSFSLGMMPVPEVAEVIEDLVDNKQKLIFAAASNQGNLGQRMWPAAAPGVFAIHATNDLGQPDTTLNPGTKDKKDNFAVLGSQIESYWDGKHRSISGTSFASPVAAAIAANVLEIARRTEELPDASKRGLNRYGAMRDLFRNYMSQNKGDGQEHVVMPWNNGMWDGITPPHKIIEAFREVTR